MLRPPEGCVGWSVSAPSRRLYNECLGFADLRSIIPIYSLYIILLYLGFAHLSFGLIGTIAGQTVRPYRTPNRRRGGGWRGNSEGFRQLSLL